MWEDEKRRRQLTRKWIVGVHVKAQLVRLNRYDKVKLSTLPWGGRSLVSSLLRVSVLGNIFSPLALSCSSWQRGVTGVLGRFVIKVSIITSQLSCVDEEIVHPLFILYQR